MQSDIIAYLSSPDTHGGASVRVVETHVSVVFICGENVYKMKRAVQFPFSDFRTLDARQSACEREVALNKRTAPSIYKGVLPVILDEKGALRLGGDGAAVEWLVHMAHFDEDTLFDRLAGIERGLRRPVMEQLADDIAAFHKTADVHTDAGGHAGLRAIAENNQQSFAALG